MALERAADTFAWWRHFAESDGWVTIRLDAQRRVRVLPDAAATALAAMQEGRRPVRGMRLPPRIDAWLQRALGSSAADQAPPLVLAGRGVSVTLRVVPGLYEHEPTLILLRCATTALAPTLTPREWEILHWVAAGKSDAQIAAILGRSPRTVQKHLEHVYVKLGVENRTAAAMRAAEPSIPTTRPRGARPAGTP